MNPIYDHARDRDRIMAEARRRYHEERPLLVAEAKVLRLQVAIFAALPYIDTPHVRASLLRAIEETK